MVPIQVLHFSNLPEHSSQKTSSLKLSFFKNKKKNKKSIWYLFYISKGVKQIKAD